MKGVITLDYTFLGHGSPPVVGSPDGTPWRKAITGAAPPTCKSVAGFMELALTATNEAQNVCFYHGDELGLDIDDLIQMDIWAKVSANLAADVKVSMGLASARNNDPDAIAAAALFRLSGNNTALVETDDGVTDVAAVSTGFSLSTSVRRMSIEFGAGVKTVSGGLSTGGKSSVIFSMENGQGVLRRVAPNTTFDMGGYSAGLQPFFQIQKTAGVSTGTLSIKRIRLKYRQDD